MLFFTVIDGVTTKAPLWEEPEEPDLGKTVTSTFFLLFFCTKHEVQKQQYPTLQVCSTHNRLEIGLFGCQISIFFSIKQIHYIYPVCLNITLCQSLVQTLMSSVNMTLTYGMPDLDHIQIFLLFHLFYR